MKKGTCHCVSKVHLAVPRHSLTTKLHQPYSWLQVRGPTRFQGPAHLCCLEQRSRAANRPKTVGSLRLAMPIEKRPAPVWLWVRPKRRTREKESDKMADKRAGPRGVTNPKADVVRSESRTSFASTCHIQFTCSLYFCGVLECHTHTQYGRRCADGFRGWWRSASAV